MSVEYICPSCKASVQRRIESVVMCERCASAALSFVDLVHHITKIESDLGDYLNSATRDEMLNISQPFAELIALICHEARKLADGHDARMHALMQHERSSESHKLFDRLTSGSDEQHHDAHLSRFLESQTFNESGEVM
jgi:hypothetical protein